MRGVTTVLIAGDERLYLDLTERLVGSEARIIFCEAIGETLDRAADAAAVVVDSAIAGGGEALCRRLRADPTTATVPLLLRSRAPVETHYADEVVTGGAEAVLAALVRRCPGLAQSGFAGSQALAVAAAPVATVPTASGASTDDPWLPDPPEPLPDEDLLAYNSRYDKYLDSLVEAHERATALPLPRRMQLMEQSHRVVVMIDGVLDLAQKGVNEALRAKDLTRMRALSDGKTALFEKLQRLRSAIRTADSVPRVALGRDDPSASATMTDATADATRVDAPVPQTVARAEPVGARSGPPAAAPAAGLRAQKSQLTLAAERRAQQGSERVATRPGPRPNGSASANPAVPKDRRRREPTAARRAAAAAPSGRPLWLAIAVLVAVVLGVLLLRRPPSPPAAAPTSNHPPGMVYVTIQETPAGVLARPEARDPEEDRVTFSIRWFVEGELVPGASTVRLSADRFQVGQSVYVEVTPSDPYGNGAPMRSQGLTIQGTKRTGGIGSPSSPGGP